MNLAMNNKESYLEHGFVVIPKLITDDELNELSTMADRLIDGKLRPEIPYEGRTPPDFYTFWEPDLKEQTDLPRRRRIRLMSFMCHHQPYFMAFVRHRAIYDVVSELFGCGVQIFSDALFVKPAFGGIEAAPHQDTAFWPKLEPNALNFWLAIDRATVENACLHVIPGSHRTDLRHHKHPVQGWLLQDDEFDLSRQIPIELEPGGAIFFDTGLIHRSYPNRSARERRAMAATYISANVRHIEPWDMSLIQSYDLKYNFTPIRPA